MNKIEEIWKDIPDYEGYYQVSDLGRVRSLDRTVLTTNGQERFYKGRIMNPNVSNKGYKQYSLSVNGVYRTFRVSQLVAMTFLGHKPNGLELVVDHINGDKSDDSVDNLRIVTQRANLSTCFRSDEESLSSEYVGVSWDNSKSKWKAQICHNGVSVGLGNYDTELEASKAYQLALSKIKDSSFNHNDYKPKFSSKYKGVSFHKPSNKWYAYITINGKNKHIGLFKTELEAHNAYLQAKEQNILPTT